METLHGYLLWHLQVNTLCLNFLGQKSTYFLAILRMFLLLSWKKTEQICLMARRRSQILGCYNSVQFCVKSVQLHTPTQKEILPFLYTLH